MDGAMLGDKTNLSSSTARQDLEVVLQRGRENMRLVTRSIRAQKQHPLQAGGAARIGGGPDVSERIHDPGLVIRIIEQLKTVLDSRDQVFSEFELGDRTDLVNPAHGLRKIEC